MFKSTGFYGKDRKLTLRTTGAAVSCLLLLTAPRMASGVEPKLESVVLTTGGVAYLEHAVSGEQTGDIALSVARDQVDDVLKSIVLIDPTGSALPRARIRLPGAAPLREVFRRLPFDQNGLSNLVQLLRQLQGRIITVDGPQSVTGRILNVTRREDHVPEGDRIQVQHVVSILGDQGIQQLILENSNGIRFADATLQQQLQDALKAVAQNKIQDRKTITVSVPEPRPDALKIGYVVGAPIWKTVYKITLPPSEDADSPQPARLRGWAIIENMTGSDWENVSLTLTSSQPVTFRQSVYAPYFLDRPTVPIAVGDRPLPPPDQGATAAETVVAKRSRRLGSLETREADQLRALAPAPAAPQQMRASFAAGADERTTGGTGATPAATASAGAVHFQLPEPVSVPAGDSLMVPIVNAPLKTELVAIFNANIHANHPLLSVNLRNEQKSDLPSGAVALYRAGAPLDGENQDRRGFVGDARLSTLPSGETRFLRFATETGILINRSYDEQTSLMTGHVRDGILILRHQDRVHTDYAIRRAGDRRDPLVIEHPKRPGWKLLPADFSDVKETATHYRLRLGGDAQQQQDLAVRVTLTRSRGEQVRLDSSSEDRIAFFARATQLSPALRAALEKLITLQQNAKTAERLHQQTLARIDTIYNDQARLRDNLARVPRQSDLAGRYLSKMAEQENQLEQLNNDARRQQEALTERQDAIRQFLSELTLPE